jgi:hypothetical protein
LPGWLIKVDDPKLFYSAKKGKKCEARKAEAGRLRAQIPYLGVLLPFISLVCRALPTLDSLLIDRRNFQRDDPITLVAWNNPQDALFFRRKNDGTGETTVKEGERCSEGVEVST